MSKSSPIYISDDSEDEKEENCSDQGVFPEDDRSNPGRDIFSPLVQTTKVKKEVEETTPTKSPLNISPKIKISINKDRLKWLCGVVKLAGVSPVKTESTSRNDAPTAASSAAVKRKLTTQMQETEDHILQSSSPHSIPVETEKENHTDHLQPSKSTTDEKTSSLCPPMQETEGGVPQPSSSHSLLEETEKENHVDHLQPSKSATDEETSPSCQQMQETEDGAPLPSSSHSLTQETEREDHTDHIQTSKSATDEEPSPSSPRSPWSPFSFKDLSDKPKTSNKTPKKSNLQKAIESPRKVGIFGSPQKLLKQTCISTESFSPKKLMESPSDKIEDTSHHTPPLHACQFNGYVCVQKLEKQVLPFTEFQLVVLEGIREEGLVAKYIETLISFVSKYRKPPSEICFYLLTQVLLKSGTQCIAMKSFGALKRIQALHPSVPEQIEKTSLTWEVVESIVKRMELPGCRCKRQEADSHNQQCVRSFSALKALAFLVNVMESEARRKQFCLRRTIAFRLLSLRRISRRNVNQVVWWLKECISALHCTQEDLISDSKVSSETSPDGSSPHTEDNHLYQAISLFQRLIQLSLSVSEDPESCATDLVGELLLAYNQLENLKCRTIFLQSINSHLLRSKFLEKYLEVYCKDTDENRNLSSYSGIQKIVQVDFERLPRERAYLTEDTSEVSQCHEWHRSQQDCEEMSMVLSYSLQSYLFSHHKKLQCSPKRMPLTSEEEKESKKQANSRHLSIADVDEICNMGDKVVVMAGRLMSLCHEASLNARTNQLIELLSDLKLWDPW